MINFILKKILKPKPRITKEDFYEWYSQERGKYKVTSTFWIKICDENTPVAEAYKLYKKDYKEFDKNFEYIHSLRTSDDGGWK